MEAPGVADERDLMRRTIVAHSEGREHRVSMTLGDAADVLLRIVTTARGRQTHEVARIVGSIY